MIDPLLITLFILVLEARGCLRAGEGDTQRCTNFLN
jgi:hypothetical protein